MAGEEEQGVIEFGHRVSGIRDGVDSPALRRRLAGADLYELTFELFWGELVFRAGGTDFSRSGPVLDFAYCLHGVGLDLERQPKRQYSVAEGAGEFLFTRNGDSLLIREEKGPTGSVSYKEFRTATEAFLRAVVADLCTLYPDLNKNREISKLKRG
ncbi:hypothetical protein ACFYZ9_18815 [Streptomyces sp. NPDC001691]|uniref:hypothetical protein n=1 Tax=Streptomyces sp. NPDC001691 TaxID=3364600 RepID=UPI0036AD3116